MPWNLTVAMATNTRHKVTVLTPAPVEVIAQVIAYDQASGKVVLWLPNEGRQWRVLEQNIVALEAL